MLVALQMFVKCDRLLQALYCIYYYHH